MPTEEKIKSETLSIHEKCEKIYNLYEKDSKNKFTEKIYDGLPPAVVKRINNIPIERRTNAVRTVKGMLRLNYEDYSTKRIIMSYLHAEGREFYDTRGYLPRIYTKDYLELKLESIIAEACSEKNLEENSQRIAWVEMDMNALKGMNDVFGHDVGNLAIKRTAQSLKDFPKDPEVEERGIESIVSIQGGDEFTMLVTDTKEDIAKDKNFIEGQINYNLSKIDNSDILMSRRTSQKLPEGKINLSVSVGAVTLNEALNAIDINQNDTYETVIGKIKSYLSSTADQISTKESKPAVKANISDSNPLMNYLFGFRK